MSSTLPRAAAGLRLCSRESSGAGSPASSERPSSSPTRGSSSGRLSSRIGSSSSRPTPRRSSSTVTTPRSASARRSSTAGHPPRRADAARGGRGSRAVGPTAAAGRWRPRAGRAGRRLAPAGPVLAVGEPYWRSWPLPPAPELDGSSLRTDEDEWLPLPETIERAESAGVRVLSLIASSEDDWDRYESLHWQTLDTWLAANPDHPQAEEFRARGTADRDRYLRWERAVMGWAIFVCRA